MSSLQTPIDVKPPSPASTKIAVDARDPFDDDLPSVSKRPPSECVQRCRVACVSFRLDCWAGTDELSDASNDVRSTTNGHVAVAVRHAVCWPGRHHSCDGNLGATNSLLQGVQAGGNAVKKIHVVRS